MKVFIIMHDLLTWPRRMIDCLPGHEIILVDNSSSYPPLLEWYKDCPHQVVFCSNIGHKSPWIACGDWMRHEPYVVTDPDLDLSHLPSDWPEKALRAMELTGETKVGLAIDTSELAPDCPARVHSPVMRPDLVDLNGVLLDGVPVVSLAVDTTFAVYAPGRGYAMDGISLGRPYAVRHLPWHMKRIDSEYRYYMENAGLAAQYASYLKGAHRG